MPAPLSPCLGFPQPILGCPYLPPSLQEPRKLLAAIDRPWASSSLHSKLAINCWVVQEVCKLFLWVAEFLSKNILHKLTASASTELKPSRQSLGRSATSCGGWGASFAQSGIYAKIVCRWFGGGKKTATVSPKGLAPEAAESKGLRGRNSGQEAARERRPWEVADMAGRVQVTGERQAPNLGVTPDDIWITSGAQKSLTQPDSRSPAGLSNTQQRFLNSFGEILSQQLTHYQPPGSAPAQTHPKTHTAMTHDG